MRFIDYIVVHCSATREHQEFDAQDIDAWHKKRGWLGCGYHYVVLLDGTVQMGRPERMAGAHVKGYNHNSIGICYIGGLDANGKPKDTRTPQQKQALKKLIASQKRKFPKAQVKGHRDFPKVKKDCPCYDAELEYQTI